MQKYLFLLLILFGFESEAQRIKFFALDQSNYPKLSAKYVIYNEKGKIIPIVKNQLDLTYQNDTIEKLRISQYDDSKIVPTSVVLAIDVSGSMFGLNMAIAKESARQFIELTPLFQSEIAIVAFDNRADLRMDFTQNKDELLATIDDLSAGGGTEYNEAFSNDLLGAIEVAKRGDHEKVIIFLTDGLGFADESKVIAHAKENKVSVYSMAVNMPLPDVLKNISTGTGGKGFGNVSTIYDAQATYIGLLQIIEKSKFGSVSWTAPPTCDAEQAFKFSYLNNQQKLTVPIPDSLQIRMSFSTGFVDFGKPTPDLRLQKKPLKMKTMRGGIQVDSVAVSDTTHFNFYSRNQLPMFVDTVDEISFVVKYLPENDSLRFARLRLYTQECGLKEVFVQGGDRTKIPAGLNLLKILIPNGKEVFATGEKIAVNWLSVNEMAYASFSLSTDKGNNFVNIGTLRGGMGKLTLPGEKGTECLMKVEENGGCASTYTVNMGINIEKMLRFPNHFDFLIHDYKQAIIWNSNTKKRSNLGKLKLKSLKDIAISSSGNLCLIRDNTGMGIYNRELDTIQYLKPKSFLKIIKLQGHKGSITDACFSTNEQFIYSIGRDKKLIKWDLNSYEQLKKAKIEPSFSGKLYQNKTGDTLLLHDKRNFALINPATFEIVDYKKFSSDSSLDYLVVHPDGFLLGVNYKTMYRLSWDLKEIKEIFKTPEKIERIDFSPDSYNILVTTRNRLMIFDAKTLVHKQSKIIDNMNNHGNTLYGEISDEFVVANRKELMKISSYKSGYYMDISDDFFTIDEASTHLGVVDFDEVFVNQMLTGIFSNFLTNTSLTLPLNIQDIKIVGPDSSNFYIVSNKPPFTVEAGEKAKVEFAFAPLSIGPKEAELHIVTPSETLITKIKGLSIPAPFRVQSQYINFGRVKPMARVSKNTVILENVSTKYLKLADVQIRGKNKGQFIFKKAKLKTGLSPGEQLKFKIDYLPTRRGITTLCLDFYFEDIPYPASVTLMGECVAPKYIPVRIKTYDKFSGKPIPPNTLSYDIDAEKTYSKGKIQRDKKTSFIKLPIGRKVLLRVGSRGYFSDSTELFYNTILADDYVEMKYYLIKSKYTKNELIATLFFATGADNLTPKSKKQLSELLAYMQQTKKTKIAIEGHTDDEGSDEVNEKLSLSRAESVKNYLVGAGIEAHRITTAGFSKNKPLFENSDEANRHKNRRAEIIFKE